MTNENTRKSVSYKRCLRVACELMLGGILYGHDYESIFAELLEKDGCVCSLNMMEYIVEHIEELDH